LEEFFGDKKLKDSERHVVIPVYNLTKRKLECFTKRKKSRSINERCN